MQEGAAEEEEGGQEVLLEQEEEEETRLVLKFKLAMILHAMLPIPEDAWFCVFSSSSRSLYRIN